MADQETNESPMDQDTKKDFKIGEFNSIEDFTNVSANRKF